jgi:DNA-binding LacI/PurR family transcriptional regulator
VNYRRGIEKILKYLHSLGHRKLGLIGHYAVLERINERLRTVKKAVTRYPSLEVRTAADADTLEGGREAARSLLSTGFDPTAIICVNGHYRRGRLTGTPGTGFARAAGYLCDWVR